jgi:hypothetical protein
MKDHTKFRSSPSEHHNKTAFKSSLYYAFRAGASPRLIVFAVILVMNLAFIIPSMFGLLPAAALITAVSLSGMAIGVMTVFNVLGDVSIGSTVFSASGAPFYALTPAPRRNTLLASAIAMFVMDFVTMAISITSVVILSINLGGHFLDLNFLQMMASSYGFDVQYAFMVFAIGVAFYFFLVMLIMFSRTLRKSVFYTKRAGGFLAFLAGVGIFYLFTVSTLLLIPFGTVTWLYGFISITVGYLGMGMYALLMLIFAAVMFILTSRLMERKMNI